MFRKVIKTETYKPERTSVGAFGIKDILECGHVIRNKGSAGYAKKRKCSECEGLKAGSIIFKTIGNKQELWDTEKNMPYRVPLVRIP